MSDRPRTDLGWFEELYAKTEQDPPWQRERQRISLEQWVEAQGLDGGDTKRAAVVGCGLGTDAEYIASKNYNTVGFDLSPTAIRRAQQLHPDSNVEYVTADLLRLPSDWRHAFDLVVEVWTVQALPDPPRTQAIEAIASLVAPGGDLIVIAIARDDDGPDHRARRRPAVVPQPQHHQQVRHAHGPDHPRHPPRPRPRGPGPPPVLDRPLHPELRNECLNTCDQPVKCGTPARQIADRPERACPALQAAADRCRHRRDPRDRLRLRPEPVPRRPPSRRRSHRGPAPAIRPRPRPGRRLARAGRGLRRLHDRPGGTAAPARRSRARPGSSATSPAATPTTARHAPGRRAADRDRHRDARPQQRQRRRRRAGPPRPDDHAARDDRPARLGAERRRAPRGRSARRPRTRGWSRARSPRSPPSARSSPRWRS